MFAPGRADRRRRPPERESGRVPLRNGMKTPTGVSGTTRSSRRLGGTEWGDFPCAPTLFQPYRRRKRVLVYHADSREMVARFRGEA